MPETAVTMYQQEIGTLFRAIYRTAPVETEWASAANRTIYCPRVDIAVGPFATGSDRLIHEYDQLMNVSRSFIRRLISHHLTNTANIHPGLLIPDPIAHVDHVFEQLRQTNRNARCFMAIEVENKGSKKHLMGSAINAAMLGRIGVAVGWTENKLTSFVRLKAYLETLAHADRKTIDVTNLLILSKDQLHQTIQLEIGG